MVTTSASSLSERLANKQQQDQAAEQLRISKLQETHESGLKKLSQAALDTTSTITQSQQGLLKAALTESQRLVSESNKKTNVSLQRLNTQIDTLGQQTQKRMFWLMLWPVLATVLVCLVMIGSATAWSLWTVSQSSSQSNQILSDQRIKLQQMNREFCSSPAGKIYCRSSQ